LFSLDLKNGAVLWKSKGVNIFSDQNVYIIENSIICYKSLGDGEYLLAVYDRNTGLPKFDLRKWLNIKTIPLLNFSEVSKDSIVCGVSNEGDSLYSFKLNLDLLK
jgi:hypothetical protein